MEELSLEPFSEHLLCIVSAARVHNTLVVLFCLHRSRGYHPTCRSLHHLVWSSIDGPALYVAFGLHDV